ncbi:hypothetical protein [Staphylococcus hominis]|uniref:hypothetical protein n=1 Tax=Staphylococcus hominis TaxID=1290 RepID=UPI00098A7692|nr:hypothetical protein [Staphylococcus hominis]
MYLLQIILSIINPIITIGGLIFVQLRFNKNLENTQKQFERKIRDSLDSKSEWRKKLFEIAGKEPIEIEDVFQLRAGLRFTEKNFENLDTYFDKMNFVIIRYCKLITKENDIETLLENTDLYKNKNLTLQSQETIRLFCRYMLADHWEKNQNKDLKYNDENKEKELYNYTLREFLKLQGVLEESDNDKDLDEVFERNFKNKRIKKSHLS